ncbi:MAG: hypothetical protein JSV42_09665 [Chloroflexota bacterium]|nr:MAG: hypothetical protein JSV42_09665 [Chloroflexota bacterium]
MNRKRSILGIILASLMLFILMSAAVPLPNSHSLASLHEKSDLVSLEVKNDSTSYAYLWLDGPSFYYLIIKPGETKTFTVMRGEYFEEVSYCGVRESSIIDLSRHTKLVMPVCGANMRSMPSSPNVINITNTIKIVKVTVENESDSQVLAILTGPATYVFLLNKDESKDYTIAKGDYEVQYFACGKYDVKEFSAYYNSLLKFKCPK